MADVARNRLLTFVLTMALLSFAERASALDFMTDAEVMKDIVGGNFSGHYADGRPWREEYRSDNQLTYSDSQRKVEGYWTLSDGVFCTLYWREIAGGCWRVRKVGTNCVEFYAASTMPGSRPSTPAQWTARGWKSDKAPTCGAPQIS